MFLSYSSNYVKTKVFEIFPVPEKHTNKLEDEEKIKITMTIMGVSSIITNFTCLASLVLSMLVQTQLGHYPYHPTLIDFQFKVTRSNQINEQNTSFDKCKRQLSREVCVEMRLCNGIAGLLPLLK